ARLAAMVRTVSRTGALYAIGSGFDRPVNLLPGDDWEPLLTRDQWQAEHMEAAASEWERNCWNRPFTMRKLGPGEAFVYSKRYMFGKETAGYAVERGRWFLEHRHERQADYDYYELPDLSEPETLGAEIIRRAENDNREPAP